MRPEWRVQGTKPLMYSHINNHNTGTHIQLLDDKVIKSRFAKYGIGHVNRLKETFKRC